MTCPPSHSACFRVRISASPPNATCSGCRGSSTGRKLELGFLAPLATTAMRPKWRVSSSRIRLDSLQSYRCRTNDGSSATRFMARGSGGAVEVFGHDLRAADQGLEQACVGIPQPAADLAPQVHLDQGELLQVLPVQLVEA